MGEKTVLVIEDNDLNMKLFNSLLQIGRHRALNAMNAEDGIRIAKERKPDLILMDIQLPGMDGISATRLIKEDPALKEIPVIGLTGYAPEGDGENFRNAGFHGYLGKPIDVRNFLDTLQRLLHPEGDSGAR